MNATYVLDARAATDHFPGIGRYVRALANHLPAELQANEQLILLHNPSEGRMPAAPPARVVELPRAASVFGLPQQWQVPDRLRALGATLYHSPYYLMPYWPGVPTVLTVYDLIPLQHPHLVSPRARLLFRWTLRRALRAADLVITVSDHTKRSLLAHFPLPPTRVHTLRLAVGPPFGPQPVEIITHVRARYQLPERYVLYFGSNKPHKNLGRLIQAWQIVLDRQAVSGAEIPLIIAGAWDPRYSMPSTLTSRFGLQAQVRFLGPIPEVDLPGLYAGAQVFVYPSLEEGFGFPVLEAMACGTPVACSQAGSLPEVAGEAALLFDPSSPEAIAAVLQELLASPERRATARERGLAQASGFSWSRTARETLRVYRMIR